MAPFCPRQTNTLKNNAARPFSSLFLCSGVVWYSMQMCEPLGTCVRVYVCMYVCVCVWTLMYS